MIILRVLSASYCFLEAEDPEKDINIYQFTRWLRNGRNGHSYDDLAALPDIAWGWLHGVPMTAGGSGKRFVNYLMLRLRDSPATWLRVRRVRHQDSGRVDAEDKGKANKILSSAHRSVTL